ncbi:MAG: glycosyltransferase [Bacteroidia bacterium]|nr:glycosyltransferase [Bacteroidia bacterium]
MKLSVIIVNYNVKHFLEQALHSVRKACAGIDAEVWVVDNRSVDGSVEMVQQKFPEVKLIANRENLGFSKANNQAILQSAGRYILLLNPDTVVEEDTFKKVIDFMDRTPDAGAVGVKMIDGKGNFLPESKRGLPTPEVAFYKIFGLSKLFPRSHKFGRYHLGYLSENETHTVDVLAGAFMMLRKKALDETGLLDETFFMYGEDIDLSYRITKAGYKNYYFPETTIIHYKGESTKKTSVNYVFVFYNAMVIFARKHYSRSLASSFSFLIHIAIYLRAAFALCSRFAKAIAVPLLDASLITTGMYYIKEYWERNHRYVQGGEYGPELMIYYVPAYTLIWLFSCYLHGVYGKENTPQKILRGIFSGTIVIAFLYAFLPENMRNSRALILLGTGWAAFALTFYRTLIHFIRFKSLNFGESHSRKTIIVGDGEEADRVLNLLERSGARTKFVGFAGIEKKPLNNNFYLGNVNELNEIISIFQVDEIIFCSKNLPAHRIIGWMTSIRQQEVHFKIVPEESLFIIGSDSKDAPGDFYSIDISLSLSKEQSLRSKRILDIVLSLLFIGLSPVLILFNHPVHYLRNLLHVLLGKNTWVGYASAGGEPKLPKIKSGILSPLDELKNTHIDAVTTEKLNFMYAKEYSVERDLNIIIKSLYKLGRSN